ncbi:hypothetical protein Tsubulata_041035 [Turnera subulata]|uniref:RRM domain-containing protein n=1 Tax=Turnera subulata TaxID=218843 RepID=A0A9Q0FVT7_9ROSI|nr:hypothetical protein Tsubulata_041035 [Turnera subulata]
MNSSTGRQPSPPDHRPTPYFSKWSRDQVQRAMVNREVVILYVENLPESGKPVDIHRVLSKYGEVIDVYVPQKSSREGTRFGFVRFRGVRDIQRLLSDVNHVQVEKGSVRANIAKERGRIVRDREKQPRRIVSVPRTMTGGGSRVSEWKSYAHVVQGSGQMRVDEGYEPQEVGITIVSMSETLQWLSRSAVGVLRNPASMDSVLLVWVLHGMREVAVTDMGGDKVLVSFPSKECMDLFLQ